MRRELDLHHSWVCATNNEILFLTLSTSAAFYTKCPGRVLCSGGQLTLSFEQLKQQLLEPQIVRMPDPQRDFILEIDGSRIAFGAVLNQRFDDTGIDHPFGFFSKSFTGSERNCCIRGRNVCSSLRSRTLQNVPTKIEFLLRTEHSALRNLLEEIYPRRLGLNDK